MTRKIKKITALCFAVFLGICLLVSFQMHKTKTEKDEQGLLDKVDQLFQTKDVIADGQKMEITGEFGNRSYSLSSGGFTIYELSKESGGYVKSRITAGDIKYKEEQFTYSYGYKSSNWETPRSCYDASFEFLLLGNKDNRKTSFTENTFTEIKDFPNGFYTDLHYIENIEHPTEFYIRQNGTGQVYNTSREISYYQQKEYYALKDNKEAIQKSLMIYLAVGAVIAILLTLFVFIILKFFVPSAGKSESIINTKWKNIENGTILTLEPQLFGKFSVTLLEDEKLKRGTSKFTENGNHLHLSFADTEIYYRISNISKDKLELENLTSNKIVCFERLGTNAYKKSEEEAAKEINADDENKS